MTDREISDKVTERMMEVWGSKYIENIPEGRKVLSAMIKISQFVKKEFNNSLSSLEALIILGETTKLLVDEVEKDVKSKGHTD